MDCVNMISYGSATMNDAQFLFDLKNDPGVKASSIWTRDGVKMEDHLKWLKRATKDKQLGLFLIYKNNLRIGTFRIQNTRIIPYWIVEIAIHLMPDYRNNGIGERVLNDWCDNEITTYVAKILRYNRSSIKLFEKCGFERKEYCHINNLPVYLYFKNYEKANVG